MTDKDLKFQTSSANEDSEISKGSSNERSGIKKLPPLVQGVIWVVLLGFLAFIATGLLRAQKSIVAVGEPAPEFVLTTFADDQYPQGRDIALMDLRGKVVVINFWASWCKPCESEAADMEEAW